MFEIEFKFDFNLFGFELKFKFLKKLQNCIHSFALLSDHQSHSFNDFGLCKPGYGVNGMWWELMMLLWFQSIACSLKF